MKLKACCCDVVEYPQVQLEIAQFADSLRARDTQGTTEHTLAGLPTTASLPVHPRTPEGVTRSSGSPKQEDSPSVSEHTNGPDTLMSTPSSPYDLVFKRPRRGSTLLAAMQAALRVSRPNRAATAKPWRPTPPDMATVVGGSVLAPSTMGHVQAPHGSTETSVHDPSAPTTSRVASGGGAAAAGSVGGESGASVEEGPGSTSGTRNDSGASRVSEPSTEGASTRAEAVTEEPLASSTTPDQSETLDTTSRGRSHVAATTATGAASAQSTQDRTAVRDAASVMTSSSGLATPVASRQPQQPPLTSSPALRKPAPPPLIPPPRSHTPRKKPLVPGTLLSSGKSVPAPPPHSVAPEAHQVGIHIVLRFQLKHASKRAKLYQKTIPELRAVTLAHMAAFLPANTTASHLVFQISQARKRGAPVMTTTDVIDTTEKLCTALALCGSEGVVVEVIVQKPSAVVGGTDGTMQRTHETPGSDTASAARPMESLRRKRQAWQETLAKVMKTPRANLADVVCSGSLHALSRCCAVHHWSAACAAARPYVVWCGVLRVPSSASRNTRLSFYGRNRFRTSFFFFFFFIFFFSIARTPSRRRQPASAIRCTALCCGSCRRHTVPCAISTHGDPPTCIPCAIPTPSYSAQLERCCLFRGWQAVRGRRRQACAQPSRQQNELCRRHWGAAHRNIVRADAHARVPCDPADIGEEEKEGAACVPAGLVVTGPVAGVSGDFRASCIPVPAEARASGHVHAAEHVWRRHRRRVQWSCRRGRCIVVAGVGRGRCFTAA